MIDKSILLAALAPVTTTAEVEGFGTIRLRQISVAENDTLRAIAKDAPASEFGLRLLTLAAVDETGAPLFDEADLPALRASSGPKVERLVEAVVAANFKPAGLGNVPAA